MLAARKELLNYDGHNIGEVDLLFPSWKKVVLEQLVLGLYSVACVHSCMVLIVTESSAPTLL